MYANRLLHHHSHTIPTPEKSSYLTPRSTKKPSETLSVLAFGRLEDTA